MRRGFIILALGFVGAVAAYYGLYLLGTATPRTWLRSQQPELAWLKHEFSLSDAEFARISQLHEGYLPQCKERCRHIEQLNNKLMKAIGATTQMTPEIEKLLADRARMRADCQTDMLYAIASNLVRDRFRWRSRHRQVSLDTENEGTGNDFRETI